MAKVTIHDVAREANVSIGTVYRAVNNSGRINEYTRQRVLDTVERLGYKANTVARGLALRNKFNILVIMPQVPEFFWHDVIKGVRRAAQELSEYGVKIIEFYHRLGRVNNQTLMEFIAERKIDAIAMAIVNLDDSGQVLKYAADRQIPVAVLNEDTVSRDRLFFYGPDNHLAGRLAAELMYKFCGSGGSCCIVSSPGVYGGSTISYRQEGFMEYMDSVRNNFHFHGVFRCSIGESELAVGQILAEHPEIKGYYFDQNTSLNRTHRQFAEQPNKPVVIGHEYSVELEPYLKNGTLTALLVQEKVCQGYHPVKMLYQHLVSGEPTARDHYYSNINIVVASNTSCLHYENNGCGYE